MDDIFWQVFWLTLICSPFAIYFKVLWTYSTLPYMQRTFQKQNILYVYRECRREMFAHSFASIP